MPVVEKRGHVKMTIARARAGQSSSGLSAEEVGLTLRDSRAPVQQPR
jgi:hypothetical protein